MKTKEQLDYWNNLSYVDACELRDGFCWELQMLYAVRNSIIDKEGSFEEIESIDKIIERIKFYLFDCMTEISKKFDIHPDEWEEIEYIISREQEISKNNNSKL